MSRRNALVLGREQVADGAGGQNILLLWLLNINLRQQEHVKRSFIDPADTGIA